MQDQDLKEGKIISGEKLARINETQTKELMHRSIGVLTCLNKHNKVVTGSGFLISKNLVLTATNNIYDRSVGEEHTSFRFYLGVNGVPKKYYQVQQIRYPQEYKTCKGNKKIQFGIALLKLKKDVQFRQGFLINFLFDKIMGNNAEQQFFQLFIPCEQCMLKKNEQIILSIYGYPTEENMSQNKLWNQINLYQQGLAQNNRIFAISSKDRKICYGISTLEGQRGCPVVVDKNIIAIHLGGGDKHQPFNIGRVIDFYLINLLETWCQQVKGSPFKISFKDFCPHLQTIEKDYQKEKQEQKNKHTTKLEIKYKQIKQINVSEYTNLAHLYLSNNKLSEIDVTKNTNLTLLHLYNNQISTINLTKNTNLTHLYLSNNQLSQIDIAKNTHLTVLYLSNNQISAIDVTNNTDLSDLRLSKNQLSEINVIKNMKLTHLQFQKNQLSAIDVANNTNLTHLYLSNNKISAIDVNKNTNLTVLSLPNNKLSTIDVSNNTNLNELRLQSNQLSGIDLFNNTYLTILQLSNNLLSSIDLIKNTVLTELWLSNNKFFSIDVSKNTHLTELFLQNNQLSEIEVTKNTNLTRLWLYNNKLSAIKLIKDIKLDQLRLQNNCLKTVQLSLLPSKPIECYLDSFYFNVSHQLSTICEIQIHCTSADKQKCIQLQEELAKKYREKGENKHECQYTFLAVEE